MTQFICYYTVILKGFGETHKSAPRDVTMGIDTLQVPTQQLSCVLFFFFILIRICGKFNTVTNSAKHETKTTTKREINALVLDLYEACKAFVQESSLKNNGCKINMA